MKLLRWSLRLLVLLLVQILVLLLLSKICNRHLQLCNHLLVKAVIKRQEDKPLQRKWRKCWKTQYKNSKKASKGSKQCKFRRKFQKNLLDRMERHDNLFGESMQSLQENVHTLTQTMTLGFLMLGQIMNQGVPHNPPPSHYQPSNFGSPITSSFSCKSNSKSNLNLGESSNISGRHSQNNGNIAKTGEEKTYYSYKRILYILYNMWTFRKQHFQTQSLEEPC